MSAPTDAEHENDTRLLESYLAAHPETRQVALLLSAFGGHTATIFVPVSKARSLAGGARLRTPGNLNRDSMPSGHWRMAYITLEPDNLVPDWTTLRPCGTRSDQAIVLCSSLSEATRPQDPGWGDARMALRRVEAKAMSLGFDIKAGMEVEFTFLPTIKSTDVYHVPAVPHFSSAGNRSLLRDIVFEVVDILEQNGVLVDNYHTEGGGQWELALTPYPAVQAVDNVIYTREIIREVAYKHGVHVTLHPTPAPENSATAGQHAHFSLNGPDADSQSDHFLAGIMEHFQAVTAFLLGGYDSYHAQRRMWTGGGVVAWSRGKFAPVRRFEPNHFESRLNDALCCPYLQLAAVVAAGLEGIEKQTQLTLKSIDVPGFTAGPPDKKILEDAGVNAHLPTKLEEAVDRLDEDAKKGAPWIELLGEDLVQEYITYRRDEIAQQSVQDKEERRLAVVQHV